MSRLLVICMLSIALASLVTSVTTANSKVDCQGSACPQKKAGSGSGTSQTSENTRRHSTAALKIHPKMALGSESSVALDSRSVRWNSGTSVERDGDGREKRWAYGWTRCARGSYFHPGLGRCVRKENYYADGTSGESSVHYADPWRAKPEMRQRRKWLSSSDSVAGNRYWFKIEPKQIAERQSLRRPYRPRRYQERRTLEAPLRQTEVHRAITGTQGRTDEQWGKDRSGPIRLWREQRSRLYREPRHSRRERGFWSKLFHIQSSSPSQTTKHEAATVNPSTLASISKQTIVNAGKADKPQTTQTTHEHENTRTGTGSDIDPLISKLEKEFAANLTESKILSPVPAVLKINYEPKGIESPGQNNDQSKVSDDSGGIFHGTETGAPKDLFNGERQKAVEKYKTDLTGTDIENTEGKDSWTSKDLTEKAPNSLSLLLSPMTLNETFESNSADFPASNNGGTDNLQTKLPEEESVASKDFLKKQIQKPVGERYKMLTTGTDVENTRTRDSWSTKNLAGKVVAFQNALPPHLALNETFGLKTVESPIPNRDHSEVIGYPGRILAGTMSSVPNDLSKQWHKPVGNRYKLLTAGPDIQNTKIKSSWATKDLPGQVGRTSDHRPMNGFGKVSENTVNSGKYEGLSSSYSETIPSTEPKRRRDVVIPGSRTMFSDIVKGVGQMPDFLSNTGVAGDTSEVLPLKEKIHRLYELARNPVYNSQWFSADAQSSALFNRLTENEAGIKSVNNEQKGFKWWHATPSDDTGIQNQQSLVPTESDTSGQLLPFYKAVDLNKVTEMEKQKSSRGEDLHHEDTIAGKLISGLIKRPGEPISASGLNGPTEEQAIARTHEGPMTPIYEDSYSEVIPVDYGPQDFDLGPSIGEETQSRKNKDTLEYPLPNNLGGDQWRHQSFSGHDVPHIQDLGGMNSQAIRSYPQWSHGMGAEFTSQDQHLVSPQFTSLVQQTDRNQNSFTNLPEASIQGIFRSGRLFPFSPSISLDQAEHRPFVENANHFHDFPPRLQHLIFAGAFPGGRVDHTDEQHFHEDSSHGLAPLKSMRPVSGSVNSAQMPGEFEQGAYKQGLSNDQRKRNFVYDDVRQRSTADTAVARRLRVQRALRKFDRDTTGLMQSNLPLVLPLPLQMNSGDLFQQSLPEMNFYNLDASQYYEPQSQNSIPEDQLLNMFAGSENQYSQTSNTANRDNIEFIPQNDPEYSESLHSSYFVPNSAQVETSGVFQNPEMNIPNAPQTWLGSQNNYGSFEGYQTPPSAGAKNQEENIPSQIVGLSHEATNENKILDSDKVPPQNYIPIYNYTLAEQKNVQIPIPTSNESTYAFHNSDLPNRVMEDTPVSASPEPTIQYEYPKAIKVTKIEAPLYPFSGRSVEQVSEGSGRSGFLMFNESVSEEVAETPVKGNSDVHENVLSSTKAPENWSNMSLVGDLGEQPPGLTVNGTNSVTSEGQFQQQLQQQQQQQQQLGSLLSQNVHQTGVEAIMRQPLSHSVNSFSPHIKKAGSEIGKFHHFGTLVANDFKSLQSHQPTKHQREESQLYSNTDSDAARAAYQKWLNERINMQAKVLQALQPRSAQGQVSAPSGLNEQNQLSRGAVEIVGPTGTNVIKGDTVPVRGNNIPAVLRISVDIPSYAKIRRQQAAILQSSGFIHPLQDSTISGRKFGDDSHVEKVLDEKQHDNAGEDHLGNIRSREGNEQSSQVQLQNSQQNSADDLSLTSSVRRLHEQYAGPSSDVRKSNFQKFIPQSVATDSWMKKMAAIKSICNDRKAYGHELPNTFLLPRAKRQVVIYDDFLRDLLKVMNIGERYLFPPGDEQKKDNLKEINDSNQLQQFTSPNDGALVKKQKEIRITVDKIKDLCEIIQENPSLLDNIFSKIHPEETPKPNLESTIYKDPIISSSEQVENPASNFLNKDILYTNSAKLNYSPEPREGSHMEQIHETAEGPHGDHIHETGVGFHAGDPHGDHTHETGGGSHTDHINHLGSHSGFLEDTGQGSHAGHIHIADEDSHPDSYHNVGETSHTDHYHSSGEGSHPDHWPIVDNGPPNVDNGPHPHQWPNVDNSPHKDHWPNVDHNPHTDHWPDVDQSPHPGHWHNAEVFSHTDHLYHSGEEPHREHLYDTDDNSHLDHSYDTDESSSVLGNDEYGEEDWLQNPEELQDEDTEEIQTSHHMSTVVETSIDTQRCGDHLINKLTIQIPTELWKLLQEGTGAHTQDDDTLTNNPIVKIQFEVPVFEHNGSNFEDIPMGAFMTIKRNTLEKGKKFLFHLNPTLNEDDITKLENEGKASASRYSSQDDVSSLHQRTVSEFLQSLPGMQRTPSFNGPESNTTVFQFAPGVYPEGIGQTKRQENSYFTENEGTKFALGAEPNSGNVAEFHNSIQSQENNVGRSKESKTLLATNDPRLLSLSIYHSRPGGLKIMPEGGGTVPLRVVGPNGEVLYDTNKECQSVPPKPYPVNLVPAQVTEIHNTDKDSNTCINSSCKQWSGSSTIANGVSNIPNVQLRNVDDLIRFLQTPNQPSAGVVKRKLKSLLTKPLSEGRNGNLGTGRGARKRVGNGVGNGRYIRSGVLKKEKEREVINKFGIAHRHSLSKRTFGEETSGSPKRSSARFLQAEISQKPSKTHRHTAEERFSRTNTQETSVRHPEDPAVAVMKQTLENDEATILKKDKNDESNNCKMVTDGGEFFSGINKGKRHTRRLLWLEENEDDEETVLPKVYPRMPRHLVVGTLPEQTDIDEQSDLKTLPLQFLSQFPGEYSDFRRHPDDYNATQRSPKRSSSLHHDGSSYVTRLRSLRRRSKVGRTSHLQGHLVSPHQQKRKSGLSHYFLKSQLARNHLRPSVRNGKYEPSSWPPNTGKHQQTRIVKDREAVRAWLLRPSPRVRHSSYWSTVDTDKPKHGYEQLFAGGRFESKQRREVPDKNVSTGENQGHNTNNTTVNASTQAQGMEENSSVLSSLVPVQMTEPHNTVHDTTLCNNSSCTEPSGSTQSMTVATTASPHHSETSSTEPSVNNTTVGGNHSTDQSQTPSESITTEISNAVEGHTHTPTYDEATESNPKFSGADQVDASLDLRLKIQYDKNKGALKGEIQDFHVLTGCLPKENESNADVIQSHNQELQHATLTRAYHTIPHFHHGTVFPAKSPRERLALFEHSVRHGGRSHTFRGTPNSYKQNFDLKEAPKNDLPPSNYKSLSNFPFRRKDEAMGNAMSHEETSSNQYPYKKSYFQNGALHHYPLISYFSSNQNIENVVHGQSTLTDFLLSQSNPKTLSHSADKKLNDVTSKLESLSQTKNVENSVGDNVPDSETISASVTNKHRYQRSDWMDISPTHVRYVPEENNFQRLVGKRASRLRDSYTITTSFASNTDDEDSNLQEESLQNRRQTVGECGAPNQRNIPVRVNYQQVQYPFTDTNNAKNLKMATNSPELIASARSKQNVPMSPKDGGSAGDDFDSSDEDWKHHLDLDNIEIVHSLQHGRKILQENEGKVDYEDDKGDQVSDKLLLEYGKLQNIGAKREVNNNDFKFMVHPKSNDSFLNSKRSLHFRDRVRARRMPKRLHPKFRGHSVAKSQSISSSIKKTERHGKSSIHSEPVYLTTDLETKKSAHFSSSGNGLKPHEIQIKKPEAIKNDVPKIMRSRVVNNAERFPVEDDNIHQTLEVRKYGSDKNSKKHILPTSALQVRSRTHKIQQLSHKPKSINSSHSHSKHSKTSLHQHKSTKIKAKKERGKKNKDRNRNLNSKKRTHTYPSKHSKHKHNPLKRRYLDHSASFKENQRQYRSKSTRNALDEGNPLHKQRHHIRKKRSTYEREMSSNQQTKLTEPNSGEPKQSEVKYYESNSVPLNKLSLHKYGSFSGSSPRDMKSENVVKSVDFENNFLGINLKSPVTSSRESVANETHYLKKMSVETVGKSGLFKRPRSPKLNYRYNLIKHVSADEKVKPENHKLTDKMNSYAMSYYCSDGFHHFLPCSAAASDHEYHELKQHKLNRPALSTKVLDKGDEVKQKSITVTGNSKQFSSGEFLPGERIVNDEHPQKSILNAGSHLKQEQWGPLSGHHTDVGSSIYRNTHNAQHFSSMNISENVIPPIKFAGLSDSETKNKISELQNLYRHHHLQHANQLKHLSYANVQDSKPVLLSDSMHVFGKGVVGTTGTGSNLAEKRKNDDSGERTRLLPNKKLPQKPFRSRDKEKIQMSDKIDKNRLVGGNRKPTEFHPVENPKLQSHNRVNDIQLSKSEDIQQNEHRNRGQENSSIITMNKDSNLFDENVTSKQGIEDTNLHNYSFNVYKQQLSSQSSDKRVNKEDLLRNLKIRADQADTLTENYDTSFEITESDIVVTTIPDIVSDEEEEDEYEMSIPTVPVIPKPDAKNRWNFEPEDVTEANDYIEEDNTYVEVSTFMSLQPVSFTEIVPHETLVQDWPEFEVSNEAVVSANQITAKLNEWPLTSERPMTEGGTDSTVGPIPEDGLTSETVVLAESQVETEIPDEKVHTAITETYNSKVENKDENQMTENVDTMEIKTTEMEMENEGENENEGTAVPETIETPGKLILTSTFLTTMDKMKITPQITVTANVMPEETEVTEQVTEEEAGEYENSSDTEILSISASEKENEKETLLQVESTESVSHESVLTETYDTEGSFTLEGAEGGEEGGEVEGEGEVSGEEDVTATEEEETAITVPLTRYPETEMYTENEAPAVTVEISGSSTEYEASEETETDATENEAELKTVPEEYTQESSLEDSDAGSAAEAVEVAELQQTTEEATEEITAALATTSEGEEGEETEEAEEEIGEGGYEEVGEQGSTEGIIGTLAPTFEEEGGEAEGEEEVGEGIGEEEVDEEETTGGIIGTLAPTSEEEENGVEGEEEQEEGQRGEGITEGIAGTLVPASEEEEEEEEEEKEEDGGVGGGEEVGEELEGADVGEVETTEGIVGTLVPTSEEEEGGVEGEEEVGEELGEEDIGEEETTEGFASTLVPMSEYEEGGIEEEEDGGEGEEVGEEEIVEGKATSTETAEKMHKDTEPSTNKPETETVEKEGTTEEEETEKATSAKVKTTEVVVKETTEAEEGETTEKEEKNNEQEFTNVMKTTEEEGTTEREVITETEETMREEEVYEEYLASEEVTQETVQPGEMTLAVKGGKCHINQSSCICSLDDMLRDLSAATKGSSVSMAASHYDNTCPKYSGQVGKFKITNDMQPIVPHQKERDKDTVRLMKNITTIGIIAALAVSDTAVSGQEALVFPGSHITIPCANTTEMFQVDDKGISYRWWSPSGKELTDGHAELIEDGKYLRLSGVVPRDDGTYRCETPTLDNMTASSTYVHKVRVVQLPQVVQQVAVRYSITPHCGEDMAQLLQLFLAPAVRKSVCGQLCSISIPKASCKTGEDGRPQMKVIFLSRLGHAHLLLPGHEQSGCDVPCTAKVDAIFARTAALNLPRVLASKVSFRLSYRTADLSPLPGNMVVSLLEGCPAGFGLQDGLCTPCDAQCYSPDDDPNCRECPEGEYQPNRGSHKCLPCPHPFAAASCLALFHQRYSYTAMATAGSLFLVIIILLLIIMPTIKRQNSLKTRSPYRPDKPRGSGKRTPNKRHNSVRHVTGERKPTDYGNIGYTAVNVDPLEEELYHTYGDGAHLSRPEIIQRSKVQIANEVNRLVDEAAARVVQEQQLGRHKKHRSPFVPRHPKIHSLYDDGERRIIPVNTYSSSLGSSTVGYRDYIQQDLLGIQTPTVPVYDNSQDHIGYREWKADSKQKKHRRSKESHTRNRVYRVDKVHDEELGKRHTDSQKEHVREESPQRRDVKKQDSFISSLGLIVEEDENGQEDGLQTQTVQDAQLWNKESISSFLLPQSTDESDIVRKQAPSPPPPDF